MTLDFDPSADFARAADGTEPVMLHRRGSTPGSSPTAVPCALRRAVTTREAAQSHGQYTESDVTWHLPAEQLSSPPRLGDLILDDEDRRWTVLDVQLTTLRSRWRCVCRNLAVVHRLDDTVTILKAGYVKGDGGAAEPIWRPWKTGIRARIQPVATDVGTEHQARRSAARYEIFVEEDLALDQTHRIQGPDGTIYKVLGTAGAERIGQLQTIHAEVTPWPAG